MVRKLGFSLLLVGFVWLVAYQSGVLLRGARPAMREPLVKLDQQQSKSYSKQEVAQLLAEAGAAQYESTPPIVLPCIVMLIGGPLGLSSQRAPA